MKRMRDYSRWSLDRLREKAAHIRATIARCEAAGTPCGANRLVLAEVERQIRLKRGRMA